jgi:hypothetical protein
MRVENVGLILIELRECDYSQPGFLKDFPLHRICVRLATMSRAARETESQPVISIDHQKRIAGLHDANRTACRTEKRTKPVEQDE